MSEQAHPGSHPDADLLGAFAENVLSEHERVACLTHLSECARCREIVYLTQAAVAQAEVAGDARVPVPQAPKRFRKRWFIERWFTPAPALVAAAAIVVVSIGLYRLNRSGAPAPQLAASTQAPAEVAATLDTPKQPLTSQSAPAKTPPAAKVEVQHAPAGHLRPQTLAEATPVVTLPSPPGPLVERTTAIPPPALPSPASAFVDTQATLQRNAAIAPLAEVEGTITDPAGAVIANAHVDVVDAKGRVFTSTTDRSGQFSVEAPPGRYELQITSPGFRRTSKPIDLQSRQIARADSRLELGTSAETVTVNAEASLLKTETGEVGGTSASPVATLPALSARSNAGGAMLSVPDKVAPLATVTKNKIMLAVDSSGALFLSKNSGKSWKTVKGPWQGKVTRLNTTQDLFQLTTDSGSVWLSRDGSRWSAAPASR